jgi:hypothetical protein
MAMNGAQFPLLCEFSASDEKKDKHRANINNVGM